MARKHLEYYRAADPDVLKVMNDTGYAPIGKVRIDRAEDWLKLEPTPVSDAIFQSHIEGLRLISEAVSDEVLIMTTAFSPYHRAMAMLAASGPGGRTLSTTEACSIFWEHARSHPEALLQGLRVIAEDLANYYAACIVEGGIQGLYYSAKGGERTICSDAEHAYFIGASDLQVLSHTTKVAEFIVGHFCGRELNLERFAEYPVHMANWACQSGNLSLTEGKKLFGSTPILGGLDERGPLVYGPRASLRQEIEQVLAEAGSTGFMLGAGCTVPSDVDISNLVYAREMIGELTAS